VNSQHEQLTPPTEKLSCQQLFALLFVGLCDDCVERQPSPKNFFIL
jgi:hypothetical protein